MTFNKKGRGTIINGKLFLVGMKVRVFQTEFKRITGEISEIRTDEGLLSPDVFVKIDPVPEEVITEIRRVGLNSYEAKFSENVQMKFAETMRFPAIILERTAMR